MQNQVQIPFPQPVDPYKKSRYKPPVAYCVTEIIVLGILAWRAEGLHNFESSEFFVFWVLAGLTISLYFATAFTSPGHITLAISKEDKEEDRQSNHKYTFSNDNLDIFRDEQDETNVRRKNSFPELVMRPYSTEGNNVAKKPLALPRLTEYLPDLYNNKFSFQNDAALLLDNRSQHNLSSERCADVETKQKPNETSLVPDIEPYSKQEMLPNNTNSLEKDLYTTDKILGLKHESKGKPSHILTLPMTSVRSTMVPAGEEQKASAQCSDIQEAHVEVLNEDPNTSKDPEAALGTPSKQDDPYVEQVRVEDKAQSLDVPNNYCTLCRVVQPFRCKHCKVCKRCVPTFDHHCLWMGTCIGENNKRIFFVYIVLQLVHCIWALVQIFKILCESRSFSSWAAYNWFILVFCAADLYFIALLSILLTFHLFLCLNNLTTWEILSWEKITYMAVWPFEYGSPFSQGWTSNVHQYWCQADYKVGKYIEWSMPKQLPANKTKGPCFIRLRFLFKWLCS